MTRVDVLSILSGYGAAVVVFLAAHWTVPPPLVVPGALVWLALLGFAIRASRRRVLGLMITLPAAAASALGIVYAIRTGAGLPMTG